MTPRWPLRLLLILYFLLLSLVAVNFMIVVDWPLWLSPVPPLFALTALATVWGITGTRHALFVCLLTTGTIALVAVTIVLVMPAWYVISEGASHSLAAQMMPMLIAALALHACNLWITTMDSGEAGQSLERLARLLYGPGILPSLLTALMLCAGAILAMELIARGGDVMQALTRRFLERGIIPPLTLLLFLWGALLLVGKWWNNLYLRRMLARWRATIGDTETTSFATDLHALSTTAAALEENVQLLWRRHEESWLLPRYLSWAVPILGFIGTVLGISLAADGIRHIIASDAGLASLSSELDGAIAPLGIAFDTTLIALSLSVVLTLLLALVQRFEERLLAVLERHLREVARDT